jgi:NitT/TauT family transport system ATP-binding protein/sulfonate transport system ATP-binding protein
MPNPNESGASTARPILHAHDVCKTYSTDAGPVEALRNIDLKIARGEFVCLLGASGCGKSTLLRVIAGFEEATRGQLLMNGVETEGPGPERGMVFQDYALFPWLTVRQNIAFGPKHTGVSSAEVSELCDRFLKMVGLESFADRYPHQLSGGMRQRVAIARVLANDADALLMDEPFGALDALTREKLQIELLDIWKRTRTTIIFVTHSVEEALILADRVVVMSAGPGQVLSDIPIDLPRPRDVSSEQFNSLRRDITRQLTSQIAATVSKAEVVND